MVVSLLLILIRKGKGEAYSKSRPRVKSLFYIYCILVCVFLFFSVYSEFTGLRSFEWYLFLTLIGMLSIYFGGSPSHGQRGFSIGVVIAMAVMMSVAPIVQNRGVVFGTDQWRDLKITTYIVQAGTFHDAPWLGASYYAFIPLYNVIGAEISEVLGLPPMAAFTVLQVIFSLLSALAIYAIMMKLSGRTEPSLVALILFLSIPRLSIVQIVPSVAALSLGFLLVLLLVKGCGNLSRSVLMMVAMLVLTISIIHPIGLIPISAVCFGIIALSYLFSRERLATQTIFVVRSVLGLCLLTPLAYWSLNDQVFAGVFNPLLRLFNVITSIRVSPSTYVPQYQGSGFEQFSFAWALPVAFSAAFFITAFKWRKWKLRFGRDLNLHIFTSAAFCGLLIILTAFIMIVRSPGGGLERYLTMPGYFLLLLPSAFVFDQFLSAHNKVVVLIAILLLSTTLIIGTRSPDWSPFENPTFGAVRSTLTGSTEASTLASFFPNGTQLFEDYDIPLAEVARLNDILFKIDISYITTRNVIEALSGNYSKISDPAYKGAVFVIKTERIVNQGLFNAHVNVLYSSKNHVAFVPF